MKNSEVKLVYFIPEINCNNEMVNISTINK